MEDTICAIATSSGIGAISIVRVSGEDAINIVNKIFKGKDLTKAKSHTIFYGHIYDAGELIDQVLISLMKAPKTYTKEDTVEINCHGGRNTTLKVLETLVKNGCRLATPGEFTKRAFLNGRINLIQAESVNDLILAETDAKRTLALNNMDGKLADKIRNIRNQMSDILANIEVNIDYPEYEDELVITEKMLEQHLTKYLKELKLIVAEAKNGKIINEGIDVAIIGQPNVGKSSILNFLLDEEKAIVTDIPGTTRDIVEGSITLNGVKINFLDTAGIRKTEDIVEKIGVEKSLDVAKKADLIIFCLNNNQEITVEETKLLNELKNKEIIVFVNKSDLPRNINLDKLKNYVVGNTKDINGLDTLKEAIKEKFNLSSIVNKDMNYLTNVRQITLITKAVMALENAYKAYLENKEVDIIEIDLKQAWNFLGELLGESYEEELIDNLFSKFCLGK